VRTEKFTQLDQALNAGQLDVLSQWLPGVRLVQDLSWHQTDTVVLRIHCDNNEYIVKTAGKQNHHFDREFDAHHSVTAPLVASGVAASLRFASKQARLIVLDYLPGVLVDATPVEEIASVHYQAGQALRILHAVDSFTDAEYEYRIHEKCWRLLETQHRIKPAVTERIVDVLDAYTPQPTTVVPTHGDWQPRNWLENQGRLYVIDFGRFEYRPAATDLVRLASQQWRGRPDLEAAFLAGYGHDPRTATQWGMQYLYEGLATSVWSYSMGDEEFEMQGHQMLFDALQLLNGNA